MKAPNARARILFVDDHAIVRTSIANFLNLQEDLECVAEVADVDEAISFLATTDVDLVITDISMKGHSGLTLVQILRKKRPQLPVLVLSMHDAASMAEPAFRAGARGYVMKHEAPEQLLGAIRKVLGGGYHLGPVLESRLVTQLFGEADVEQPSGTLTPRDIELLHMLIEGKTSADMAAAMNRSIKSIEAYRAGLRRKLRVRSNAEMLQVATKLLNRD